MCIEGVGGAAVRVCGWLGGEGGGGGGGCLCGKPCLLFFGLHGAFAGCM